MEGSLHISPTLPKTVRKWAKEAKGQHVARERGPTPTRQICGPRWCPALGRHRGRDAKPQPPLGPPTFLLLLGHSVPVLVSQAREEKRWKEDKVGRERHTQLLPLYVGLLQQCL